MRSRFSGFTLVELLLVMSLLVALTLMVTPVFSTALRDTKVDQSVRDFAALFEFAQARALSEVREYRVVVDTAEHRFWLMRLTHREKGRKVFETVSSRDNLSGHFSRRLSVQPSGAKRDVVQGAEYVSFYPDGSMDVVSFKMTVRGEPSLRYRIATDGLSVALEHEGE